MTLFMDEASPGSALWHGEMPSVAEIAQIIGADAVLPMAKLDSASAATIAVQDAYTQLLQSQVLKRPITLQGIDLELAHARSHLCE